MYRNSHRGVKLAFFTLAFLLLALFSSAAVGQEANGPDKPAGASGGAEASSDAIERLIQAAGGQAQVNLNRATGVAGFVRFTGPDGFQTGRALSAAGAAASFLRDFGAAFGIQDAPAQVELLESRTDDSGRRRLTYRQTYQGVEVFAGILRVHLNARNRLTAVNGVFVPNIAINSNPTLSAASAAGKAMAELLAHPPRNEVTGAALALSAGDLNVVSNKLYVYREGLLQGISGPTYLVYEVQLTGGGLRAFVYVNAHSGAIVNRIDASQDALFRRLYETSTALQVWQEGDPFPGLLNQDQQNIVNFTGHSYYHFFNAYGRDSYDGGGIEMEAISNAPISCPNASWNGSTTNYCNGVTSDDVVAHEWGHAYTEYTSNLIYQWQSGALNEAYSDIWGETVDMLNGMGTDAPAPVRADGVCSVYTPAIPVLTVNSPDSIAGDYAAAGALFGPPLDETGVTGNVVLGDDGVGSTTDACEPLVNGGDINGNIALVDRGSCAFAVKVKNAQNAGATAVIVANNVVGPPGTMGGSDPTIVIPSVMVAMSTGDLIKGELANGVNATMAIGTGTAPEDSYRWLMGEDSTAFGGAIRDMWTPTCLADPGKVSDAQYHCATSDAGGVHSNSGIVNHGYALLVDGGSYNGQTITAIGLTKAAHIYWRAQSEYLTPASNFADHGVALQASCQDLIGQDLAALSTDSTPPGSSGEVISQADCDAISNMIAAVEYDLDPAAQCNFQPLLEPNAPALCADTPYAASTVYVDDFEAGLGGWTLTNQGVFLGWPGFDWAQASSLPDGRPGSAAFATDPIIGSCDGGEGDVSGVMRMESGEIVVPADALISPRLAFDHYVATEPGWDGGNLSISVNGGPYTLVPALAFTFNDYNTTLNPGAAGNTNPLAGQPAFSGSDGGTVEGSWGQSQIDLATLGVVPGDTVRLRYDLGMDGCNGLDGWYVDDVHVYTCEQPQAPVCDAAAPSLSRLWPPNHRFRPINIVGVTDPNGDPITIAIDTIFQDEAVRAPGTGNTAPDGIGIGTSTAGVRAERIEGDDGRVYHITFTASDGTGESCTGEVLVGVPPTIGGTAVDDGALYDSTQP